MLIFLVSCLSFFLLFSESFLGPFLTLKTKMKMVLLPGFREKLQGFMASGCKGSSFFQPLPSMEKNMGSETGDVEEKKVTLLLELPDLALECILENLSPVELCRMAGVCRSLREICTRDHLWDKHMKQKWGKLIGHAAYTKWKSHIASLENAPKHQQCRMQSSPFGYFSSIFSHLGYESKAKEGNVLRISSPEDSLTSLYLALETGKFWFPGQVYNREVQNGHVGFMLSCYDAELSYDSETETFIARYSVHGRRTIEENIQWNRLRAPAVYTPANVLHKTDCLDDLKPDDHIEIQWRRNREFPYGWWYGVVGHLESCDGNEFNCQCQTNETVVLEFKQYSPSSRWRRMTVNRKDHKEVGNEADGFYGGIRKLYRKEEIETWKKLWPSCTLE